jgi:hypothetical protein
MSFKLSFFRIGDRVRYGDQSGIGTVVGVGPKELRVFVDWFHEPGEYWRFKAEDIFEIIDAADGRRSSS